MSLIETLLSRVIKYKSEITGLESIRVHKIAAGYSIHTFIWILLFGTLSSTVNDPSFTIQFCVNYILFKIFKNDCIVRGVPKLSQRQRHNQNASLLSLGKCSFLKNKNNVSVLGVSNNGTSLAKARQPFTQFYFRTRNCNTDTSNGLQYQDLELSKSTQKLLV